MGVQGDHIHRFVPRWAEPRSVAARIAGPTGWLWVVGLSFGTGAILSVSPAVATLHELATFGLLVGVGLAARSPAPILVVTAYAGAADVLWRSAEASGPYEASKYALIFGFMCILFRLIRRPRNLGLVTAFLLVLIPAVVMGASRLGVFGVREYVVANLSGLVALSMGVLVCSNLRATPDEVRGLYLAALSPAVAVGAIATLSTFGAEKIEFRDVSNFETAGGFGPNQVSALLCFGGLLCILVVLQAKVTLRERVFALATAAWLVGQAVLTFSRGGVYALAIAALAVGLTALTISSYRGRTIVAAAVVCVMGVLVLSWTGAFTDGASGDRLGNTETSRSELNEADIALFYEHPITGVGVGMAKFDRNFDQLSAPHTEYTRLLAEHGIAGVIALLLLGLMSWRIIRDAAGWYRMAAVGLIVMSLAQMAHSATRIGCIALGFALAALREEKSAGPEGRPL